MNLAHNQSHLENPLDRALLAYFHDRKGKWIDRVSAMKQCGFDDPTVHRVGAYVQFQHSVNRINAEIEYRHLKIIQDEEARDLFSLQDGSYGQ